MRHMIMLMAMALSVSQATARETNSFASASQPLTQIDGAFKLSDANIIHMVTGNDAARLYPHQAADRHLGGRSTVRCHVQKDGFLSDCSVVSESPVGFGFGAATIMLAHEIRLEANLYGSSATTDFSNAVGY